MQTFFSKQFLKKLLFCEKALLIRYRSLTNKLSRPVYKRFKSIAAFKKFYGRHKILVDEYKNFGYKHHV